MKPKALARCPPSPATSRTSSSVARCVEWISDRWTGLDVVIPSAGIGYFDPLENAKIEEWHAMVDVNVTGVLNTLRDAASLVGVQRARGEHRLLGRPTSVPQQRHLLRPSTPSWPFLSRSGDSSRASWPSPRSTQARSTPLHRPNHQRRTAGQLPPQFDVGMTPEYVAERPCLRWKAEAEASSASSPPSRHKN